MSATVYGINTGGFTPNPDFSATQSDKGGWTATQTFQYVRGSLSDAVFRNTFSKNRRATEIDTNLDAYWARLYLDKVSISAGVGGIDTITVNYAGYAGFESGESGSTPLETVPAYSLKGTLKERTIMEHPKVIALSEWDRTCVEECIKGEYIWDPIAGALKYKDGESGIELWEEVGTQPTAGDAVLFCKKASMGIVTYEVPSYSWTKSWESEQPIAPATLNNLGKIDTPDGDPPTPDGSRDYLMVDVSMEQQGLLYRNSLEWKMSERGGHDADLYS